MSKRKLVEIGEIFGNYIVIDNDIELSKDYKVKYHVKCSCGKIEFVRGYFLRKGRQICCKSCRSKINYQNAINTNKKIGFIKYGHSGVGDITKSVYGVIKRNAKRRNFIWSKELTIEYLWNLYLQQNKKCALSGLDIYFTDKRIGGNINYQFMNASLDRIDSSIGYTKDNIQWVHKDVNMMKLNHSEKYFIDLCKKISEYNKIS